MLAVYLKRNTRMEINFQYVSMTKDVMIQVENNFLCGNQTYPNTVSFQTGLNKQNYSNEKFRNNKHHQFLFKIWHIPTKLNKRWTHGGYKFPKNKKQKNPHHPISIRSLLFRPKKWKCFFFFT